MIINNIITRKKVIADGILVRQTCGPDSFVTVACEILVRMRRKCLNVQRHTNRFWYTCNEGHITRLLSVTIVLKT